MIDSHCHIDLYDEPFETATIAERMQIQTVAVTHLPSHYELAVQHLKEFKFVHPALGLHPLVAAEHVGELEDFRKHAVKAKFIGEVGLDYSRAGESTRLLQQNSFELVVDSIKGSSKFVTIHSRKAEDAVLDILKSGGIGPVVFHWFSGSQKQLKSVLDAGHYISINTSMIAASKWNDLIKCAPKTQVLTESDGPFVKVGGKPASPLNMKTVLQWLGIQWKMRTEDAEKQVTTNFKMLADGQKAIME